MEKRKNELVIYNDQGEIIECNFPRVDLENPSTILEYGNDVKDTISNILDNTAKLSSPREEEKVLDENTLNAIATFDESLDESEKMKNKTGLGKLIRNSKKWLGTKMGIDSLKKEADLETYQGRYQEYCRGISKIGKAVESQKMGSLRDINLRTSIINDMIPQIEQLEAMIKVGHLDKQAYDDETQNLEAQPQDIDTQHQIQYRTQISNVFNNKLNALEKALIAYKGQIQSYRLQQKTDMELVISQDSYLKDIEPILRAQGSIMVFNRQQKERLDTMQQLNELANQAITENASQIEANVNQAVELSINGGISIDTLKSLDDSLKRGLDVFKKGNIQKQTNIENERKALVEINESLNLYNQEVLNLIDNNAVMANLIQNNTTDSSKVKKIGVKK